MIAFPRTALASELVAALQGRALLGDAHNGLFLAAPRRTGKSTFLQGDLRPALQAAGVDYDSADASFVPSMHVELDEDGAGKVFRLVEALEDLDDVQNVFANFDVSDDVMAALDA